MNDYARGFDDGFAAAVRASGNKGNGAAGYTDDTNENIRKISIGFDATLFDRINAIARQSGQSFSATVRNIVRHALTVI